MAKKMNDHRESSWNPFRCGGTTLPTPLLLSAKLIVVTLLLTNHVRTIPDPFLPFFAVFDHIDSVHIFQRTLQTTFIGASLALVFNRSVRLSAFIIGMVILLGIAASQIYWSNNTFYCGVILLLIGLYQHDRGQWLLRIQVALIYLGSGINKALDPAWQSGQFFEHWTSVNLNHQTYLEVASWFPPLALSKMMCWATIMVEWLLFLGFLMPRFWTVALWLGIFFHAFMTLFAGMTFVLFFYVVLASYLIFARWPSTRAAVLYDGDCAFCERTKQFFERFDLEKQFEWIPFQSNRANSFGIDPDRLRQRLHMVIENRVLTGFQAFKTMLLYTPLVYFAMLFGLLLFHQGPTLGRNLLIVGGFLFFFPLFNPIGETIYDFIAKRRTRFSSGSHCATE